MFKNSDIINIEEVFSHNATIMYIEMDSNPLVKIENRNKKFDMLLGDTNISNDIETDNWLDPILGDYDYISPTVHTKHIQLVSHNFSDIETDNLIQTDILNRIKQLGDISQKYSKNIFDCSYDNSVSSNFETNRKRLINKISSASHWIACEGRIGPSTNLICGFKLYDILHREFNITNLNGILSGIKISLDETITTDDIYLYSINSKEQPGLFLAYMNNSHYSIVELGFYAHKQFIKLSISGF